MIKLITANWQWLCILGCLLLCSQSAQATHAMGMDLTYDCIGGNQYEVTLSFYRDCNGINVPSRATVEWTGSCGSGSNQLTRVSVVDITPSCPGIVGTACNNGNGVFGIEKHTYTSVITLPAGCTDVVLSHRICCRNNAITTLDNANVSLYIEAEIADVDLCNNSPVFSNNPVPFGCVGQPVFYNHGAVDQDGDDLTYSLVDCEQNTNSAVSYASGLSANNPLYTNTNGLTIDANTGAITFVPTVAQVGVLCVAVTESRNGVVIGQVVRDIQFTAVPCSNTMPTLTGIDGTSDFSTTVQAGTQLCFDVNSNDVDNNQSTTLTWNNGISAGSFTTAGAPFQTGTFCWTPTANDVGANTFTVTVEDDFCPIVGQNTRTYTVNVTAPPPPPVSCDSLTVVLVSSTDLACDSSDGTAMITASSGVAPYNYQVVNWTTGMFFNNTTGSFTGLPAGNYTIWVTDANGCTPSCTGQTFTIDGNITPLTVGATAQSVDCPSNSTNAQEPDNLTGAISVNAAGGTAPFMYSIDGGNVFQLGNNFDFLAAGTYSVVVMDANGCTATTTATVTEPDPISIFITSITPATCGSPTGSITIGATGGTGVFQYYIDGQSQSTPVFNNLAPGTYTFRVCDTNYCVYDTTFTIPNNVIDLMVTAVGQAVDCPSNSYNAQDSTNQEGMVSTTVSNGTAPFQYSIDGGATFQSSPDFDFLGAGTYVVTVVDSNGCTGTDTATVTEPDPIAISVVDLVAAQCGQANGSITIAATGGTNSFQYYIDGQSQTSPVFNNLAPGTYTFRVCDTNYCVYDTTFTIPNIPGIVGIGSSMSPTCAGNCDGTATVEAADSARNFTVSWSTGETSAMITGLCAGTYTATVTDDNGCTDVVTVDVTDPAPIDVTLTSTQDETCAGNDGSATVSVSGGSAPYTINLANFTNNTSSSNSTGVFTGLNAGQFVVNVTDDNGCQADCSTNFVLEGCDNNGGGGGGDDDDDDDDDGGVIFFRTNVIGNAPIALELNPNPASSIVQVRYQTAAKSVQLTVIDSNGKLVYNKGGIAASGSLEIAVNDWAESTYFVLMKDQEGKIVKSTKLVISK